MTAYLVQGQTNTPGLLTRIFVNSEGFLFDPTEVSARLLDPSGVEFLAWQDVLVSGKYKQGVYYLPVTLPVDATTGLWRIEWRWKSDVGQISYSTASETFQVEPGFDSGAGTGFHGFPFKSILSPTEARQLGITALETSDSNLERILREVHDYIEKETRSWFRPVYLEHRVDGPNGNTLMLPLAIIGFGDIHINEASSPQSHSSYRPNFYRIDGFDPSVPKPDPRYNPHLTVLRNTNLFQGNYARYGTRVFAAGVANVKISGVFGFLDGDGNVPPLIKRAALKLVYSTATKHSVSAGDSIPTGQVTSRTVDFYSESYYQMKGSSTVLTSSLARSPEVEQILKTFRAPLALGAPVLSSEMYNWSW